MVVGPGKLGSDSRQLKAAVATWHQFGVQAGAKKSGAFAALWRYSRGLHALGDGFFEGE